MGIVIDDNDEQLLNAPLSMPVILSGIVISSKEEQPAKEPPGIDVIPEPMVTSFSDEQSSYLQPIITQYFIDNKSEIWLLFLIAHSKR